MNHEHVFVMAVSCWGLLACEPAPPAVERTATALTTPRRVSGGGVEATSASSRPALPTGALASVGKPSSPRHSTAGSSAKTRTVVKYLRRKAKRAIASRYMAQSCKSVSHPGYEGLAVKRCRYQVADGKQAEVIMLNPSAKRLARWIAASCTAVAQRLTRRCVDFLLERIVMHSGAQFPVAGIVMEDIRPRDGVFEAYCFRDGIKIAAAGFHNGTTKVLSDADIRACMLSEVRRVFLFARLAGTLPEEYRAYGGKLAVGTSKTPTAAWLTASRSSYRKAWASGHDFFLSAWAHSRRRTLSAP